MSIDQATTFLAGSILTGLGFIVVVVTAVAINNILHKYWKPVKIFTADSWAPFGQMPRYASQEELTKIAPHISNEKDKI
jgi:hypothetical protein